MKINQRVALLVGAAFVFAATSAKADFTINPNTYNPSKPGQGVIWFDTVGAIASWDLTTGNPVGVTGGVLGDSSVNVKFLFTQNGNTATSSAFTLDTGGNFGNISVAPGSVSVTSLGVGPGAANYQVLAWVGGSDFGIGNTKNGTSALTSTTLGGPNPNGPSFTAADLTQFSNFAVTAVPEPTTLALGIVGAAGLLIRRRK